MPIRDDENYRLTATAFYQHNRDLVQSVMRVQADYGKWLIATLSVVHTGALYALADSRLSPASDCAYLAFLVGLVLTLASGLSSWINFSLVLYDYQASVDPRMLVNDDYWPKDHERRKFWTIACTMLALSLGVAAALCIPWGVYLVHG